MSDKYSKMLDLIKSEDGKKALEEWATKITNESNIRQSQLQRFHEKYSNRLDEIINKIRAKYNSDKYVYKWIGRGIEPPEHLFWFLFDYAEKYGREATNKEINEHGNTFTTQMYYIKGFFFMRMDGQGSVIKVFKE